MVTYSDIRPDAREHAVYYKNIIENEVMSRFQDVPQVSDRLRIQGIHPSLALAYSHLMRAADYDRAGELYRAALVEVPTVSKQDGGKVGYLRFPEHGPADRWTLARPMAYINRILPDVFGGRAADTLTGAADVQAMRIEWLETDAAMIDYMENARRRGCAFGSCMTGDRFAIHPYAVYAARLDWSIAALMEGDTLAARCLVNSRKAWVRIYSDSSRAVETMTTMLADLGVHKVDSWKGCRIAEVRTGSGKLVAPYMDGYCNAARFNGDGTLTVSDDGPVYMSDTSGLAEVENEHDGEVETIGGDWINEDDAVYIESRDGYVHCDDCFSCPCCDEYFLSGDEVPVYDLRDRRIYVCESCRDNEYTYIGAGSYKWDGEHIHPNNAVYSDHLGEWLHIDDALELHDGDYALADDAVQLANGDYALAVKVKVGSRSMVAFVPVSR